MIDLFPSARQGELRARARASYDPASVAMPYLVAFIILFLLGLLVACVFS
jgi:hypothetical protein